MPDDGALRMHDAGIGAERTHKLLCELLSVQREIMGALAAQRAPKSPLSRVDRHLFAAIVPEISQAVGDSGWTVRELLDHARLRDPALLTALDDAIGLDDGTGRRLGKLLARVAMFAIDGFRVEKIDDARAGTLWRVVRI